MRARIAESLPSLPTPYCRSVAVRSPARWMKYAWSSPSHHPAPCSSLLTLSMPDGAVPWLTISHLSHLAQRNAHRDELRREGVPEVVPPDLSQPFRPARAPETLVHLPERERLTSSGRRKLRAAAPKVGRWSVRHFPRALGARMSPLPCSSGYPDDAGSAAQSRSRWSGKRGEHRRLDPLAARTL
jgi:hypothetical protein